MNKPLRVLAALALSLVPLRGQVPDNLLAEGIPAISAELRQELAARTAGGAENSFAWNLMHYWAQVSGGVASTARLPKDSGVIALASGEVIP